MNREERQFRIDMRWLILIVALIAAALVGRYWGMAEAERADITVMPCSAYTSNEDIPPFTFTGACVQEDGTLASSSK